MSRDGMSKEKLIKFSDYVKNSMENGKFKMTAYWIMTEDLANLVKMGFRITEGPIGNFIFELTEADDANGVI